MACAKKCDRCGKLYEQYSSKNDRKNPNEIMVLNLDAQRKYYSHGAIDLCPGCMKEFQDWMEEVKQMERLTERIKRLQKDDLIVYTNGKYEDTIPAEMTNDDIRAVLKKLADYEDLEEQGLLVRLPCKVGDIIYVDSAILPIEDMEGYEDIDNKLPSYFQGRVVSFRFAERNWVKIAVKAKWLYEWIDDETGPESDYIEYEKKFSILLSMIGKYIFLTREEAEKKLEEMKKDGE